MPCFEIEYRYEHSAWTPPKVHNESIAVVADSMEEAIAGLRRHVLEDAQSECFAAVCVQLVQEDVLVVQSA